MQLTSFTDYALRTLVYLGLQTNDALISVKEICEHFNMPRNHVIKVTQQLSQLNYIQSTRGRQGGIRLARKPQEMTIGQVVRDFERRLTPIDCQATNCPASSRCKLKAILKRAQRAFLTELDAFTVADLIDAPEELRTLLSIDSDPVCCEENQDETAIECSQVV